MSFLHGTIFGVFGCTLYQLVILYQYRAEKGRWPWQDKKSKMTVPFFCFGFTVKLFAAAGLTGMLAYTNQISGVWAAFLIGMAAERLVAILGDTAVKEVAK